MLALSTLTAAAASAGSLPHAEAAPIPKHLMKNNENPDLAVLQGKWKSLAGIFEASAMAIPKTSADNTVEFQGDKVVQTTGATKRQTIATVKFDRNSRPRESSLPLNQPCRGRASDHHAPLQD